MTPETRGRPGALRVAALGSLVMMAAMGAVEPSCKTPDVTFNLGLPSALSSSVAWFEVGVYEDALCPSDAQLAGGVPPDGAIAQLAFAASLATPPAIGAIPRKRYAFAAVARQSDCSIIATGCQSINVGDTDSVSIALNTTPNAPVGACEAGNVCEDARCLPASDNSNANVGAGCSLELVGSGPLGDPLWDPESATSSLLSAPVIAATSTGFLIAYRELAPSSNSARLTLIPVDEGGASGTIQTSTVASCTTISDPDATGMAFSGDKGLIALARPPCTTGGAAAQVGVDFLTVDPTGTVTAKGFKAVRGTSVSLATARAVTATSSGFLMAMRIDGQTYQAPVAGVDLGASPAAFGNTPPQLDGWVGASDQGTALLAVGTGTGGTSADAGGGSDGGDTGGSTGASTLRVNTAAAGADLSKLAPGTEFPGRWGSVSMIGTRALVASDGATSGQPVAWHAFDVGNPVPVASGGFAIAELGDAIYADVVVHQDHAFFAVEVSGMVGTLSLVALDHVSTMPVYIREIPFSSQARISIGDVRDGLVSVAATDTRVGVVWGTGKTIGFNDSVGGYAIFACTP